MKLPPRVVPKDGRYWLIAQSTERGAGGRLKRKWLKLSRIDAGPAALYDALAELHRDRPATSMPGIITAWKRDVLRQPDKYTLDVRTEYEAMCGKIAKAFEDFDVADLQPKDVADLIDQWKDKPRTGNKYRSLLGLIMGYAVRKGHRDRNPVTEISGFSTQSRSRYLTDDELLAVKGKCSEMSKCMIDLALITGQRIGDLLALRWGDVRPEGIVFRPSKVKGSTGVAVPIRMSARLAAVLQRCKSATKVGSLWVIHTKKGQPLTYSGAYSNWRRACIDAKVEDANIHDLRHRAITDAKRQGLDARRLGGHSSDAMTNRYIEQAGLDWIDPPEEAKR